MKPIKKKTAKLFIVLTVIAAVLGSLFAFVPMKFGQTQFTSLLGSVSYSSELGMGVYAEYDLDGEFSNNQINNSISVIKGVLEKEGHAGANVFSVGQEKIRVEVGYNEKTDSLKETYSLLDAIGVGVFELRSSSSEEDTYIIGKDHVKSVDINTYNSAIYVVLNFNDDGLKAYEELLKASKTIYVCMGGQTMTSFSSENITAAESMPLSFTDYASAEDFAMKVKLGSMPVNINSDTININTMSIEYGVGNISANPLSSHVNVVKVIAFVAIALAVVLSLVFMILKHGVIGAFQALAVLFDSIIALVLLCVFPWVEMSLSSVFAVAIGYGLLMTTSLVYATRFEEEYKQGKTILASLESAFKKSLRGILATGIALTVIFGVVAIVASAELKVFGLITCIFASLSLFSTLIMLPGFIKIFEAFNDGARKPYRLPERGDEE